MSETEIVEPRELVRANNELFRCKFKLKDIVAGRIFMAFASLVDHAHVKENENFVEYSIPAKSILPENSDGGDNYNQLSEAARTLVGHTISQHKHDKHFRYYTLFSMIEYENGTITGQLHKDLIPFFIIAREKFTKMRLDEYMNLPSIYSQALFAFLKSWSDQKEITIQTLELHKTLGTSESFRKDFFEFKRRVLEKAHKDINELTSLKYDYEAIKTGRSYKEIKFIFHKTVNIPRQKQLPCQPTNTSNISKHTDAHKPTIKPKLDAFLARFPDWEINHLAAGMAWYKLNKTGNAPLASDVPDGNTLGVLEFLDQWQGENK